MNWKRSLIVTACVGVPVIALLAFGMTNDPRNIRSPLPGREAPVFSRAVFAPGADSALRLQVGDTVRMAENHGRVVVVNFWASWCLACRDEHRDLSETAVMYGAKGVRFYGMLYNDKEPNGLRWIEGMGGQSYPSLSDPGARVAIDYGLYGVPETFVVDQKGRVARKFTGPVSSAQLTQLIDSLLVANAETDASVHKDTSRVTAVPAPSASKQ